MSRRALVGRRRNSGAGGFGLFDHRVEGGRIVDRQLGELLAIQTDAGLLQAVDELRVAESPHARRGVDADDPQPPELPLLLPAVASAVRPGAVERLDDRAPQAM